MERITHATSTIATEKNTARTAADSQDEAAGNESSAVKNARGSPRSHVSTETEGPGPKAILRATERNVSRDGQDGILPVAPETLTPMPPMAAAARTSVEVDVSHVTVAIVATACVRMEHEEKQVREDVMKNGVETREVRLEEDNAMAVRGRMTTDASRERSAVARGEARTPPASGTIARRGRGVRRNLSLGAMAGDVSDDNRQEGERERRPCSRKRKEKII